MGLSLTEATAVADLADALYDLLPASSPWGSSRSATQPAKRAWRSTGPLAARGLPSSGFSKLPW